MPWRDANTVSFTRIEIVAYVPSASAVFGIFEGDTCLLVSESWNLKARLLELVNAAASSDSLSVKYELCPEDRLASRKAEIEAAISAQTTEAPLPVKRLPGISFWEIQNRQSL